MHHYVQHKDYGLSVDERTMKQLGLQQGQQVDQATVRRIMECDYAWCVTDLELRKAGGGVESHDDRHP